MHVLWSYHSHDLVLQPGICHLTCLYNSLQIQRHLLLRDPISFIPCSKIFARGCWIRVKNGVILTLDNLRRHVLAPIRHCDDLPWWLLLMSSIFLNSVEICIFFRNTSTYKSHFLILLISSVGAGSSTTLPRTRSQLPALKTFLLRARLVTKHWHQLMRSFFAFNFWGICHGW